MKQYYSKVPYLLALIMLILYLPRKATAQCNCADGTAALTRVESYTTIFPNNLPTGINVPQFPTSLGTLMCVNARIYLTSIVRFRLENQATVPINYTIRYVRFDTLSGPGISPEVTGLVMKNYGPYPLSATDGVSGSGPDLVVTPRDTVYNNVLYQATTGNVVPYLGNGSVNFQYASGVPTYAVGNDHYILEVAPINSLNFQLTYYYCQNTVLAQNIKNFSATLNNKDNVALKWTTQNESKNNIYEIELSDDGKQFSKVGSTKSAAADGTTAKYEYQHHLDKLSYRKLYFRVKQLSAKSPVYSEIKTVLLSPEPFAGLTVYPNPVIRQVNMEFEYPVTGDFLIQLTNQMGQVVHASRMRMNNSTTAQVDIKDPPPPGIYYLRARDAGSQLSFNAKLVFNR